MIRAKDDINRLYRDSCMLNNIYDYVSNALFKMKIKKRTDIKNNKKELNQKRNENLHKKKMDLKLKNEEIPDEKIFRNKIFTTIDNFEIYPKLKAQIIYKSCYPYNSIRTLFDKNNYKKNFKSMLQSKVSLI